MNGQPKTVPSGNGTNSLKRKRDENHESTNDDTDDRDNEPSTPTKKVARVVEDMANHSFRANTTSDTASPSTLLTPTTKSKARSVPSSANSRRTANSDSTTLPSKGMRQFASKVCETVRGRAFTTYAEVADECADSIMQEEAELRQTIGAPPVSDTRRKKDGKDAEAKNIRRRVYDALNVLMAIDVIEKTEKRIKWIGLPNEMAPELHALDRTKKLTLDRITQKRQQLSDLLVQQVCLKNLIEHNQKRAKMIAHLHAQTDGMVGSVPPAPATLISNVSGSLPASRHLLMKTPASPISPIGVSSAATGPASSRLPEWALAHRPPKKPRPASSSSSSGAPSQSNQPSSQQRQSAHMNSRYAALLLNKPSPVVSKQSSPIIDRSRHPGLPVHPQVNNSSVIHSPIKPNHPTQAAAGHGHSGASVAGSSVIGSVRPTPSVAPTPGLSVPTSPALQLPFLLLQTDHRNVLHLQATDDRQDVSIHVSGPFAVHEYWDLLRALNLHHVASYDLPRFVGASREVCAYYPPDAFTDHNIQTPQTPQTNVSHAASDIQSPIKENVKPRFVIKESHAIAATAATNHAPPASMDVSE